MILNRFFFLSGSTRELCSWPWKYAWNSAWHGWWNPGMMLTWWCQTEGFDTRGSGHINSTVPEDPMTTAQVACWRSSICTRRWRLKYAPPPAQVPWVTPWSCEKCPSTQFKWHINSHWESIWSFRGPIWAVTANPCWFMIDTSHYIEDYHIPWSVNPSEPASQENGMAPGFE